MSVPLLTKDAINIGGHKLPLPVVGAVVGILGLVLVLRARSQGSSVASVGTAATAPDLTGAAAQDQQLQIANLSQQLASIQQQLQPVPTPASVTPPVIQVGGWTVSGHPPGTGIPGFVEGASLAPPPQLMLTGAGASLIQR